MPKSPNPAALVCARFGSQERVALLVKRNPSTVSRWVRQGYIPYTYIDGLVRLATKHGVRLTRAEALLGR